MNTEEAVPISEDDFKEEYLSALEKENIKFIEKHET